MNVTYLKDRSFRAIKDRKTEELRREARFLNRIRVKAPVRYVEPLDSIAAPEEQKQRIRETGF